MVGVFVTQGFKLEQLEKEIERMELYNDSVFNAIDSWKAPRAISMFGFGEGVDERNVPESLFKLPAFKRHTVGVVSRLEAAMSMMAGNNMQALAGSLSDLGSRHVVYGVQPNHYLIVESALVRSLQHVMKDQWTLSIKKDWAAVFKFIARAMMLGAENRVEIVKATRRDAEHRKVATLRIKAIPRSKRTEALTRQSRCPATTLFNGDNLRLSDSCNSIPPTTTSRGLLDELYDEKDWDDITFSDISLSDLSSSGTNTIGSMMSGDSSIEPPKMAERKPPIVSAESASDGSHRQSPSIPDQFMFSPLSDKHSFQSPRVFHARSKILPHSLYVADGTSADTRFGPVTNSADKTPTCPRRFGHF
eukprot:scaffold3031_cov102-Cylindrotheca_fusiformis.AAC.4